MIHVNKGTSLGNSPVLLLIIAFSVCAIATDGLNELLKAAESEGIINSTQVERLLNFATGFNQDVNSKRSVEQQSIKDDAPIKWIFVKMYNQLTLLNVLYFGGSLLIIGAYSLLMTLAWEHLNSTGISVIMIGKTLAFGVGGAILWDTPYQFLGGLLCTISTGLVPYTVYWIQRALQVWPIDDPGVFEGFRIYVRPGWVVMEIATVVVGLIYLVFFVQFPFLLMPVSFSLWFLSMDITPVLTFLGMEMYDLRLKVSMAFGVGLMLAGRGMEWVYGSEPDFGYWLYLFGLISFWFAFTFSGSIPTGLTKSLYLLVNITLVLIGSYLDRVTFKLFGTVGAVLVSSTIFYAREDTQKSVVFWIMKALVAIALLSQAIKTHGIVEIMSFVICFVTFNIESLIYTATSEFYSLFVLCTNLGFISVVPSLQYWAVELNILLPSLLSLISLSVLLYHIRLVKYYPMRRHEFAKWSRITYMTYRGVMSLALSFVLMFLRQSSFAWVGGIGILVVAMIWQTERHGGPIKFTDKSVQYIILLFSILASLYLQSYMYYLISCICMTVAILSTMSPQQDMVYGFGCFLATILIFLSVPLQSKFLITIGGVFVFGYLSHLAYVVFRRSVLFPLSLIGLGLLMIYLGVMYQYYQEMIYEYTISFVPKFLYSSQASDLGIDWYPRISSAQFTVASVWSVSYLWLLYPGTMVHALVHSPLPYAGISCMIGMVLVMLLIVYTHFIMKYCPDMRSNVHVDSLKLTLNKSGEGSGFVVHIKGRKPVDLQQPKYISMNICGEHFWSSMQSHFNSLAISFVRTAILPYQLTPNLITFTGFQKGSTKFSAVVRLGTGEQGKPSIKRSVIIDNARKVSSSSSTMYCVLLYSNAFYLPFTPLCSYNMMVSEACEMLLEE